MHCTTNFENWMVVDSIPSWGKWMVRLTICGMLFLVLTVTPVSVLTVYAYQDKQRKPGTLVLRHYVKHFLPNFRDIVYREASTSLPFYQSEEIINITLPREGMESTNAVYSPIRRRAAAPWRRHIKKIIQSNKFACFMNNIIFCSILTLL